MSKRIFSWIMGLMGLSIAGIILVQLIWINNAIGVKNDLFDRSVNEALNRAAARLEDRQNMRFMMHFGGPDSLMWVQSAVPPPPGPRHFPRQTTVNTQVRVVSGSGGLRNHSYRFTDDKGVRTETIVISGPDSTEREALTKIDVERLKLDSINVVIDTLRQLAPGLHRQIDRKKRNLSTFTRRVITEVTDAERLELPLPELAGLVRAELADRDIPIGFDLGLSENDTLRRLSPGADSLALAQSAYVVRLFPHAIFDQNRKLHIRFPEQNRFILHSVSWLLAASLAFSLIILLTFTLSILFMLKQKKISEMKTDFINNMTHEFKTPIATISVAADSIVNERVIGDRDRVGYFVEMIKKENTRMNRQVEDILTIARLDKKDFEFHWEPLDVHRLIEEVAESLQLQVEARGGRLELRLEAPNPVITTDRIHWANLVYNLLDNANKYSPDEPRIELSTRNLTKGVLLTVSDRGLGMSKAVQSKIFERFYRQTSGNIHNVKGFGLGLSYVKAVLEANRGSIGVSSEPGKGSRFEVFLPFVRE